MSPSRNEKEEQRCPHHHRHLTPDSSDPFTSTLLALYYDPKIGKKPHPSQEAEHGSSDSYMRRSSLLLYGSALGRAHKTKLWCPISRDYYDAWCLKAMSIVPAALDPALADYVFGHGAGARLERQDNCLVVHSSVANAFRERSWVLVPVDDDEARSVPPPVRRWRIRCVSAARRHDNMGNTLLSTLDGEEVEWKTDDARPAARFLYYHFVVSLVRIRVDREPGWERVWEDLRMGRLRWSTPGRFLRRSVVRELVRWHGDWENEEIEGLLVDGRTFEEEERLDKKDVEEVVRRVLEAHESDDEEFSDEGIEEEDEEEPWDVDGDEGDGD